MKHRMALRTPVDGNVDEVVFTPIGNDATRVAALLSGEIDVMEPVPLQDVERVKSSGKFNVLQGPELRTIFLGMASTPRGGRASACSCRAGSRARRARPSARWASPHCASPEI